MNPLPAPLQVLDIKSDDVCLTLTSGGDNSLNLLLHGARQVVSVDCNPAQSALLEMKVAAVRCVCLLTAFGPCPSCCTATILRARMCPDSWQQGC